MNSRPVRSQKREHVLKLNLLRRHFGPIAWADAFRKLAQMRGVELNGAHNRHTPRTATVAVLAEELGIKPRTARHRLQLADELAEHSDLADKVDRGELEAKRALRIKRDREAAARRAAKPVPALPPAVLGVDHTTVLNDRRGENSPAQADIPVQLPGVDGENSPPLDTLTGLAADEKMRKRAERIQRDEVAQTRRAERTAPMVLPPLIDIRLLPWPGAPASRVSVDVLTVHHVAPLARGGPLDGGWWSAGRATAQTAAAWGLANLSRIFSGPRRVKASSFSGEKPREMGTRRKTNQNGRMTVCVGCGAQLPAPARTGRPRKRCVACATDKARLGREWRTEHPGEVAAYNEARRGGRRQRRQAARTARWA